MPEISYVAVMNAARPRVWEFVRDINNWAPLTHGYQAHEVLNDRESVWTVKGDLGPISRVTKFHVTITEWIEGERVSFSVRGLNEPINGEGAIRLGDDGNAGRTGIRGEATRHIRPRTPRLAQQVDQADLLPLQCRPRLIPELLHRSVAPQAPPDRQVQDSMAGRITSLRRIGPARHERPEPVHRRRRMRGSILQAAAERHGRLFRDRPPRQVGEQEQAPVAVPHRPLAPGGRERPVAQAAPGAVQELRERPQPRDRRLDQRLHRGALARGDRDQGKERFADGERRVAPLEVERVELRQLDLEAGIGQRPVDGVPVPRGDVRGVEHAESRLRQVPPQPAHLVPRQGQSLGRVIRQSVVVIDHAREGRRDRIQPEVAVEEGVERRA